MDPNETLRQLRALTNRALDGLNPPEPGEFAEAFAALDGWLTRGGFPPDDWS